MPARFSEGFIHEVDFFLGDRVAIVEPKAFAVAPTEAAGFSTFRSGMILCDGTKVLTKLNISINISH
jgi:hypothetical protein